ncbi:MAG: transglutaminase domain-containing protein [Lachnospiraceae bacterium]|nr:transglutaminase domain-containing protein [Lachnospiraceae bacterium]
MSHYFKSIKPRPLFCTGSLIWKILFPLFLFCLMVIFQGCNKTPEPYVSTSTTIRDNTPECLVPSADGIRNFINAYVALDTSHMDDGYIMAAYLGSNPKVKLQLIGPDHMTYTYDMTSSTYEVFPLSAGSGNYTIGVYENIIDDLYATIFSTTIEANISAPMHAFLYPNQYVKFDASSQVVSKAQELVAEAHDDLEAINFIYSFVVSNITYDFDKAENVQSGYIPNVDEILEIKTGICLDYAAVMASMLRSQRIPTRLEVGYAGDAYHAWISTYVEDQGWINGMIQFDGQNWSIMDPTFAANAGEEEIEHFIGEGGNYVTKYVY